MGMKRVVITFRNAFIYCVATTLVIFVLGEVSCRLIWGLRLYDTSERALNYNYHSRYGWFPEKGAKQIYRGGTKQIKINNNSYGFRDAEPDLSKTNRIVALGDSFVWGYDVDYGERFTEIVAAQLPSWDVVNLGVGGYGTDQEYLILEDYFDILKPKIVILVFTVDNDFIDNSTNYVYEGYYKPYFVERQGNLVLNGASPVTRPYNYYAKEIPALFSSSLISS